MLVKGVLFPLMDGARSTNTHGHRAECRTKDDFGNELR